MHAEVYKEGLSRGTHQTTFGANPAWKGFRTHEAPVPSISAFSHSAARRAPSENECRETMSAGDASSPVRCRMSLLSLFTEMPFTTDATTWLNLIVGNTARSFSFASSGTGYSGMGAFGKTE